MSVSVPNLAEARIDERIAALSEKGVVAVAPLLELLRELAEDRARLVFYGASPETLDGLRDRFLCACEAGEYLGWQPPSAVADLVGRSPETVRAWCRARKILFRDGPGGYQVEVRSALKYAGRL